MTKAFVLMTAMPPTKGHLRLIQFAAEMPVDEVKVLVCTQPDEPYPYERYAAVRDATRNLVYPTVTVSPLHKELPQDPATEGFWQMWEKILVEYGASKGDWFVTSEPYGERLAVIFDGVFMPYDPQRELLQCTHTWGAPGPVRATAIRDNMRTHFDEILPEFQPVLRTTITVFGAESTGKTTLSKELAAMINGHWLYEWARPYLETVGPDIHIKAMNDIWNGQLAAQKHTRHWRDKPFLVQDTDLYSTIGYWEQPHWAADLGPVPEGLITNAKATQSDLYLITKSNIPFEQDPIRYGGDHRESPDEFWIGIAEKYGLNYVVLEDADFIKRLSTGMWNARLACEAKAATIAYDREVF